MWDNRRRKKNSEVVDKSVEINQVESHRKKHRGGKISSLSKICKTISISSPRRGKWPEKYLRYNDQNIPKFGENIDWQIQETKHKGNQTKLHPVKLLKD